MNGTDPTLPLMRHAVATLAYRAGKALRGAPAEFGGFDGAGRKPVEILAHMGDLFDWALRLADGKYDWTSATPLPWDREVARFFAALKAFDGRLVSGVPLGVSAQKLFQGPVADALTHTGQIAMLRRLAGCPMKGENYFKADIVQGVVGIQQASPRVEF
jgi:hypothetical protein